jgi:hypothetical protein
MLWFDQWLEWWRWLISSWHVVLEFAKNRILVVHTPGQYVPPHVRYHTCDTLCDILCDMPEPHGARGAFDGESLAWQAGPLLRNP